MVLETPQKRQQSLKNRSISRKWLIFLAILLVLLGGIFRSLHIDRMVYWTDEVFSSIQVSGHGIVAPLEDDAYFRPEIAEELLNGQIVDREAIRPYQFPVASDKTYRDTLSGIISFESQHTPLYFLTARFWQQTFGHSIRVIRSISVVASLVSLGLMYGLARELFQHSATAWMATALIAVSPFHLYYAQEARPFGLWITFTLFSCLALLRAERLRTWRAWTIYSVSIVLSLYGFLFSALTCIAHLVYISLRTRLRLMQVGGYFWAALVGVASFIPWIIVLVLHPPGNYAAEAARLSYYPQAWLRNLGFLFIDFNITRESPKAHLVGFGVYLLALAAVVAYSLYFFYARAPKQTRLFLASLLLTPSVIVLLYDFGTGGQISARASYLVPVWLAIQLAVAFTVTETLLRPDRWQRLWNPMIATMLTLATVSCVLMTQAESWWPKQWDVALPEIAEIINQSDAPLVITEGDIRLFSLSHRLKPETRYLPLVNPNYTPPEYKHLWHIPEIPDGYSDVFIFDPSDAMVAGLQAKHQLEKLLDSVEKTSRRTRDTTLWKVVG